MEYHEMNPNDNYDGFMTTHPMQRFIPERCVPDNVLIPNLIPPALTRVWTGMVAITYLMNICDYSSQTVAHFDDDILLEPSLYRARRLPLTVANRCTSLKGHHVFCTLEQTTAESSRLSTVPCRIFTLRNLQLAQTMTLQS